MTIDTSAWKTYKFGNIARNLTTAVQDPLLEGIERYVGLEHIIPGNIHIKSWGNVTDGTTFTRVFHQGQVLFGKRRAYQRKAALAEFDGICSGDILVFEVNEKYIVSELLPFIVQSDKFFDYAIKTSAGSLSPRTKFKDLAKIKFKLPPLNEQKRLADLLWSVDKSINKYCNLLKKTEVCAKSFIKKVIEQAEEKFVGLIDVCDKVKDKPQDFKGEKKYYSTGAVHASSQDEYELITFGNRPSRANVYPKINDTGFAVMKNTKKIIFIDSAYNNSIFSTGFVFLRAKENILPKYLYYIVRSDFFQNQKDKKAVPGIMGGIRKNDIEKIKFPLFANSKQYEIVARLDNFELIINKTKKTIIAMKNIQKQIINQIFGRKL